MAQGSPLRASFLNLPTAVAKPAYKGEREKEHKQMFGLSLRKTFKMHEDWGIRDVGFPPKNYGMSRKAKRHDKARLMAKFAKK